MISSNEKVHTSSQYYLTALVLILAVIWKAFEKYRNNQQWNYPPGPYSLPVLGNALQVGKMPHVTFMKWAKIHGPILKLEIFSEKMIILSDPKIIKEMFSHPSALGKPSNNPMLNELFHGAYGVLNSEGDTWESQRRFTLRTLRDFGFAKTTMESLIMEDVTVTLKWLEEKHGAPVPESRMFIAPVGNTLWTMVNGQRNEWEKEESIFVKYAEETMKYLQKVMSKGVYFFPILRILFPKWTGWSEFVRSNNLMHDVLENAVHEHKDKLNTSYSRDYIDHYLKKINKTTEPQSSFYKDTGLKNLVANIFELFMAGSETMSASLSWGILCLSYNQEIQKRMQAEIDQVIGPSTLPTLSDRTKLPYVEAVVLEILRKFTTSPLGAPHRVTEDFEFQGYFLEKDTVIMPNIYAVHHDPGIWDEPETFIPERFLNKDGSKVLKHDGLIVFSEGKRKCLGETLAKDTLFLYIASIFQKFNVFPENRDVEPDFEPATGSFLIIPKSYKSIFSQRKPSGK